VPRAVWRASVTAAWAGRVRKWVSGPIDGSIGAGQAGCRPVRSNGPPAATALLPQEAERRRIARELHDEVGQSMTAILLALKRAADEPLRG
jgi:hypothetical protein